MFEHLRRYEKILVTGPHRSGTTIAAKMIAHDTGHDYIVEEEFNFSHAPSFEAILDSDYGPKVIQCPFMAHQIHCYPEALVVWMIRPKQEIYNSVSRMKNENGKKLALHNFIARELNVYHSDSDDVVEVKSENWQLQKQRLPHHLEIHYHTLADHPLWIDKRDFHYRQTHVA